MEKQIKHVLAFAAILVAVAWISTWVGGGPVDLAASEPDAYTVASGTVWIGFNPSTLEELGWSVLDTGGQHVSLLGEQMTLTINAASTLSVQAGKQERGPMMHGTLRTSGALLFTGLGDRVVVGNLVIAGRSDEKWVVVNTLEGPDEGRLVFELSLVSIDVSRADRTLRVIAEVSIADTWADNLGLPEVAGITIGMMTIDARIDAGAGVVTGKAVRSRDSAAKTASHDTGGAAAVDGSDVIIARLQSVIHYGRIGDITAFAVGTDACNEGNRRANWIAATNEHPLIFYSMYRLKDDRFEQIGMSWVKHGFYAVSQSVCQPCMDPVEYGVALGVGCSDPYSAYLNGIQSNMSRRSDANAHTGYFPYPPDWGEWDDITDKRLQVRDADLEPDLNPGARYFIQGHYIHPDDCAVGTQNNNASYRTVAILEDNPSEYKVAITGVTQREQPVIRAWQDTDSSVVEKDVPVPGEGLFILAVKTKDLANGFWRYEYALQNLNSDRSAGSFAVPLPRGAVVQNTGFHDVDYHSGEIYDMTDWLATVQDGEITWATVPYDVNPNANALRFSTIYNFRFDVNMNPGPTVVTIGLFKPGDPDEVAARITGPSLDFLDCNHNGFSDLCDIECGEGCESPCGDSVDCNDNDVPDECEPDCNANGIADSCDIRDDLSNDCNGNTVPDECEPDCDGDGIPDECDTFDDTDGDGIYDCFDLCPYTTPPGACVCPPNGRCCWPTGFCYDDYPRLFCIETGGTPDCIETPCREGCLIGDLDADGDRDLLDIARMQRCYTGPFGSPGYFTPSPECTQHFDFDEDDDIDLTDFEEFWNVHAGP